MRAKQTYILLAVFIALLIASYFLYQQRKIPERPVGPANEALMFPNFNPDDVAKIKIKSLGSESVLARDQTGTWVVPDKDNYPADKKAVERMLDAVKTMDVGTIVSRNPAKQSLYEVDKTLGTEVTFLGKDDKELAHFFVGKAGQDFFSTNIRKAGSSEVHLVGKMLTYMFKRPGGDWREKLIFDLDDSKIVKYSVESDNRAAVFAKSEKGTWSTIKPAGKEVDKEIIQRSVRGFAKLRASGFADKKDKDKFQLDKPKWTIAASTKDGEEYTFKVCGQKSKAQFFVQRADRDTVFYISKYQVEKLTKPFSEVFGTEKKKGASKVFRPQKKSPPKEKKKAKKKTSKAKAKKK